MAEIAQQPIAGERKGRRRPVSLKIDMTPMVDLGFLLITFFIFTTTLGEKKTVGLVMPKEATDYIPVPASKALTMLLTKDNRVFMYHGIFDEAKAADHIIETTYNEADGAGSIIRAKQKLLQQTDSRDDLVFIIKPLRQSSYQNVIDALDEATINGVKRYAIVAPEQGEAAYVASVAGL